MPEHTCEQCRRYREQDSIMGHCGLTNRRALSLAPVCGKALIPSGLRWRLGYDSAWYLDDLRECKDLVPGFVSPYPVTGKFIAMHSEPTLRWYRQVAHGSLHDCARQLVAQL